MHEDKMRELNRLLAEGETILQSLPEQFKPFLISLHGLRVAIGIRWAREETQGEHGSEGTKE